MNKRSISTKIITAAIAGSLLFSVTTLAQTQSKAIKAPEVTSKQKISPTPDLQRLVKENIITQEQADKIEGFLKKRAEEKQAELKKLESLSKEERENYIKENYKTRPDIFGDLISSKIITEEQANKIKESISRQHEEKLQETLKNEVTKGTIKQEQLDKINQFISKRKETIKAEKEKLTAMTPEQRKAYWEANRGNKKDLLSELTSAGIITEQQKEALSKVLPKHHHHYKKPGN